MHILITGHQGYIGPRVIAELRARWPHCRLTGVDAGWFAHRLAPTAAVFPDVGLDASWYKDVRDLQVADLAGVDAIVHLAAVSNDPMGNRFEAVTDAINHRASVRLARLAREAGVARFVFASSCSVYGQTEGDARRESDPLMPLTAYARSKVDTENGLAALAAPGFTVTALRFATACGFSARPRCDLVLNDFVFGALARGRVEVLSDGTPWRPLIEVRDMARAIAWGCARAADGDDFLAVNAGSDRWNYQVRELAEAVVARLPGVELAIDPNGQPDKRSYRVDFSLFARLAPEFQPRVGLNEAIDTLVLGFGRPTADKSPFVRLHTLAGHLESGRLDADLRWVGAA